MKSLFRMKGSLKRKLLVPLLVAGVVIAIAALAAIQVTSRAQLMSKLRDRAELVANAVNYAAESARQPGVLQRIVSAIGAEREVNLVIVAAGTPPRVIATTRHEWFGKPLAELPLKDIRDDLEEAISTRVPRHHYHEGSDELDFSTPLLLSQTGLGLSSLVNGAVMVHLDTRPTIREIQISSLRFSIGFLTALVILTILGYLLLNRHVLNTVAEIGRQVIRHRSGDSGEWVQLPADDELGNFARTLREALDRTEDALREVSLQKAALDEHAIVSITDAAGRITYANERFCAASKCSLEELLGQDHRIVASGYHAKAFYEEMWATIIQGKIWRGEICNKARDGALYWVESSIVPFPDRSGKPQRYISIQSDITARKRAQLDLLAAIEANEAVEERLRFSLKKAENLREEANAANCAKSEFLAMMSHEIRTPMNGVIGFTNLLFDTSLDDDQRSYASTIKNSAEALLIIINDILDFSKIEAGKLTVEQIPFDFQVATSEVIKLLAARATEKRIRLALEYPDTLPNVLVSDPSRTRQVLLNLTGNAVKFTPEGGAVTISVRRDPSDESRLRVSVADTGIGIPKDKQALLFNKFTQADSSTTRRFGGTGLGLAISKRLVELMGGEIGLTSEEGRGSTFWFTMKLPKSATETVVSRGGTPPVEALPATDATGRATVADTAGLRGRRILVVEDTATNQLLVRKLLQKLGCEVTIAPDGQQALTLLRGNTYDLVLMDCHMPVLDGFRATAMFREIEAIELRAASRTPVVALTADAMEGDRQKCIDAGMDDYLSKPIRPGELEAVLIRWVSKSKPLVAP